MSANVQHEPMRAITEDLGLLSTKVGLRSERGTLITVYFASKIHSAPGLGP